MKKLLILLLLVSTQAWADVSSPTEFTEADASPSVYDPWKVSVSNGTLTDNGDGSISITTGGGSGTPGGGNTSVQFNTGGTFSGDNDLLWFQNSNTLVISGDSGQSGYALIISSDTGVLQANVSHDGSAFFSGLQLNNGLKPIELAQTDVPADEECATYESGDGNIEWQSCGGSDTNAQKIFVWPASATLPLEAADSVPSISRDTGTNVDVLGVAFDDSTDECRTLNFKVPSDVASGTVTFGVDWFSAATSGNVIWDARYQSTGAEAESWDATLTTLAFAADAVQGTVRQITVSTQTETIANLGWAAGDNINVVFCRDANAAGDTMATDAIAVNFTINIPRA